MREDVAMVFHCDRCSTLTARVYHAKGKHLKNEIHRIPVPTRPRRVDELENFLKKPPIFTTEEVSETLKRVYSRIGLEAISEEITR